MAVGIDKMPPEMSGIAKKDIQNIADYLAYIRESVNFALEDLDKKIGQSAEK